MEEKKQLKLSQEELDKELALVELIAIDLDGTLLNGKKEVTDANKKAILMAKEEGIHIVICSGRPLQGVTTLLEELELMEDKDLVITYNGGLIQETVSGRVWSRQGLSYDEVAELIDLAEKIELPLVVLDEENGYQFDTAKGKKSDYLQMMPVFDYEVKELKDFRRDHHFCKALLAYELDELDQAIAKIPAEMKEKYNMFKSRQSLFEMVPKTVDKGQALRNLSRLLDMPLSKMMAIGDQSNDLPMLRVCGFPVAMANGISEVKAVAKLTTGDNEHSGVAQVIQQVIGARRKKDGII
ncbi:HAD family phosphatase [Atopobacter sp. AH10]|uniref:Cof-type HAD-IIB family hydrolase n=1 Tax=Atopobacter sp. AH10 TaxID=2315861 RepID=UPI000EF2775A|nr:Cof-type HAD-IIB family hydrolase [Atopobacter sp. AH10]RLK63284.1 HAD family phosphatase [Atopobacter sp. AH10]